MSDHICRTISPDRRSGDFFLFLLMILALSFDGVGGVNTAQADESQLKGTRFQKVSVNLSNVRPPIDPRQALKSYHENYKKWSDSVTEFLNQRKVCHREWARQIFETIVDPSQTSIKITVKSEKCEMKQLVSFLERTALTEEKEKLTELNRYLQDIDDQLTQSAVAIQRLINEGKRGKAFKFYMVHTQQLVTACFERVDGMANWVANKRELTLAVNTL